VTTRAASVGLLYQCVVLALRGGEEDGEHGHEPERVGDVVALGVGEAANEGKDEEACGEGFDGGLWSAADLPEVDPVEADNEDDAYDSEGEELLEKFVVGVGCFEVAEERDGEVEGVEAVAEDGFFDGEFSGCGPYDGAPGEGLRIGGFGVVIEIGDQESGE